MAKRLISKSGSNFDPMTLSLPQVIPIHELVLCGWILVALAYGSHWSTLPLPPLQAIRQHPWNAAHPTLLITKSRENIKPRWQLQRCTDVRAISSHTTLHFFFFFFTWQSQQLCNRQKSGGEASRL